VDATIPGMAHHVKAVVARSHVEAVVGCALVCRAGTRCVAPGRIECRRRRGCSLDQGEVDGGAGRMLRTARDITEPQQRLLLQLGKKSLGGAARTSVARPLRHGAHGAGGAVAIIDFEGEAGCCQIRLHLLERKGSIAAQNAFRGIIAGKRPPDEVIGTGVANVLRNARIDVPKIDKAGRQSCLRKACLEEEQRRRADSPQSAADRIPQRGAAAPHGRWAEAVGRAATAGRAFCPRSAQKAVTASVTAALMRPRRSGSPIATSSSRLMMDPASKRTAGMCVDLSTISWS